ncbi:hypothetical protein Q2E61_09170 [Microbulbifer thermotolerans]|uniref:hypothetical protein n=1 Tax=Microbulbifer thermotolerans TaxID=252514 RepID=UPI002672FF05|nr:hypothetical protein [Microbulbifer thermotolerans]WKT59097.1 hypothetical protein Q2E61_09170 [Microbulbifer thermotolerans]
MLPDNTLSSEAVPAPFTGGRALPVTDVIDYESGGIALQDPSRGLSVQVWRARVAHNNSAIVLDAEQVAATTLITGNNITEVSLSFDSNMRPVVAYVDDGVAKLYWYDTQQSAQVITEFAGAITPRVALDDKRALQSAGRDVIFAYLRGGNLYIRQQRDRYQTEYLLQASVDSPGLIKIGMNRELRFQFLLRNP